VSDQNQAGITRLLNEWCEGDKDALNRVLPMVYEELRKLARGHFAGERRGHALQTTELVNLVYLRLAEGKAQDFKDRNHFFWYASQMIRYILVDYARRQTSQKRGGGAVGSLDDADEPQAIQGMDLPTIISMDDALKELEKTEPRQARIVEMRFFAGMSHVEIAETLGLALSTVKRDWKEAKANLFLALNRDRPAE